MALFALVSIERVQVSGYGLQHLHLTANPCSAPAKIHRISSLVFQSGAQLVQDRTGAFLELNTSNFYFKVVNEHYLFLRHKNK
jgi:hypothetical protein